MNNLKKKNSYSISFTAGGLLYDETIALKSYLAKNNIMNIGNEIKRNQYLQTNSESARKRIIQEIGSLY